MNNESDQGDFFLMQRKQKIRPTAWLLLLVYAAACLRDPCPAYSQTAFVRAPAETAVPSFALPDLRVPSAFGTIEKEHTGSGPVIVHVQTAHGNFQAQKSIESLLRFLHHTYGFETVFVEGTGLPLRPGLLRLFPKRMDATHAIADGLARRGLAKGADLFLIGQPSARGYGIEDLRTYRQNREVFKDVLRARQKTRGFVRSLNFRLERLSAPYLNPALRVYLKRSRDFHGKKLPLDKWLEWLDAQAKETKTADLHDPAAQLDWPMLVRLFKIQELEAKIDRGALEKEKENFLRAVSRFAGKGTLDSRIRFLLSRDVNRDSLPYPQTGQLVEELVRQLPENFSYAPYPNLKMFLGHLILQSELDGSRLFDEIERLEKKTAAALAPSPEEKEILALLEKQALLKKLFDLELVPSEYRRIADASAAYRPSALVEAFRKVDPEGRARAEAFSHLREIDALFDAALEFYRLAQKRDGQMLARLTRILETKKITKAVVVTGGFHAAPFYDYFSRRNFRYVLVTPQIGEINETHDRAVYLRSMFQSRRRAEAGTLETSSPLLLPHEVLLHGADPGYEWDEAAAEFRAYAGRRGFEAAAFEKTSLARIFGAARSEMRPGEENEAMKRIILEGKGPLSLVVSLGGTKLAVGAVDENGRIWEIFPGRSWRNAFKISNRAEDGDALAEGIAKILAGAIGEIASHGTVETDAAARAAKLKRIVKIGIAVPLPFERTGEGVVMGAVTKSAMLPFEKFPLDAAIREKLKAHVGDTALAAAEKIPFDVRHDGAARLLGEVGETGTFYGRADAAAILIGTGMGVGILKERNLFEGVGQNEGTKRNDAVRILGSLGRHLVYIPDAESPLGYRYEYRGIAKGQENAALDAGKKEVLSRERLRGPALARRIAEHLKAAVHEPAAAGTLRVIGVTEKDIDDYLASTDEVDIENWDAVFLAGLTQAAQAREAWALDELKQIAEETGTAIAAFIAQFKDEPFSKNIVLVSSVGEKLGKGVRGEMSDDFFLERVRLSVEYGLATFHDMSPSVADAYSKIFRSSLDYKGEMLAFTPPRSSGAGAEEPLEMPKIRLTDEQLEEAYDAALTTVEMMNQTKRVKLPTIPLFRENLPSVRAVGQKDALLLIISYNRRHADNPFIFAGVKPEEIGLPAGTPMDKPWKKKAPPVTPPAPLPPPPAPVSRPAPKVAYEDQLKALKAQTLADFEAKVPELEANAHQAAQIFREALRQAVEESAAFVSAEIDRHKTELVAAHAAGEHADAIQSALEAAAAGMKEEWARKLPDLERQLEAQAASAVTDFQTALAAARRELTTAVNHFSYPRDLATASGPDKERVIGRARRDFGTALERAVKAAGAAADSVPSSLAPGLPARSIGAAAEAWIGEAPQRLPAGLAALILPGRYDALRKTIAAELEAALTEIAAAEAEARRLAGESFREFLDLHARGYAETAERWRAAFAGHEEITGLLETQQKTLDDERSAASGRVQAALEHSGRTLDESFVRLHETFNRLEKTGPHRKLLTVEKMEDIKTVMAEVEVKLRALARQTAGVAKRSAGQAAETYKAVGPAETELLNQLSVRLHQQRKQSVLDAEHRRLEALAHAALDGPLTELERGFAEKQTQEQTALDDAVEAAGRSFEEQAAAIVREADETLQDDVRTARETFAGVKQQETSGYKAVRERLAESFGSQVRAARSGIPTRIASLGLRKDLSAIAAPESLAEAFGGAETRAQEETARLLESLRTASTEAGRELERAGQDARAEVQESAQTSAQDLIAAWIAAESESERTANTEAVSSFAQRLRAAWQEKKAAQQEALRQAIEAEGREFETRLGDVKKALDPAWSGTIPSSLDEAGRKFKDAAGSADYDALLAEAERALEEEIRQAASGVENVFGELLEHRQAEAAGDLGKVRDLIGSLRREAGDARAALEKAESPLRERALGQAEAALAKVTGALKERAAALAAQVTRQAIEARTQYLKAEALARYEAADDEAREKFSGAVNSAPAAFEEALAAAGRDFEKNLVPEDTAAAFLAEIEPKLPAARAEFQGVLAKARDDFQTRYGRITPRFERTLRGLKSGYEDRLAAPQLEAVLSALSLEAADALWQEKERELQEALTQARAPLTQAAEAAAEESRAAAEENLERVRAEAARIAGSVRASLILPRLNELEAGILAEFDSFAGAQLPEWQAASAAEEKRFEEAIAPAEAALQKELAAEETAFKASFAGIDEALAENAALLQAKFAEDNGQLLEAYRAGAQTDKPALAAALADINAEREQALARLRTGLEQIMAEAPERQPLLAGGQEAARIESLLTEFGGALRRALDESKAQGPGILTAAQEKAKGAADNAAAELTKRAARLKDERHAAAEARRKDFDRLKDAGLSEDEKKLFETKTWTAPVELDAMEKAALPHLDWSQKGITPAKVDAIRQAAEALKKKNERKFIPLPLIAKALDLPQVRISTFFSRTYTEKTLLDLGIIPDVLSEKDLMTQVLNAVAGDMRRSPHEVLIRADAAAYFGRVDSALVNTSKNAFSVTDAGTYLAEHFGLFPKYATAETAGFRKSWAQQFLEENKLPVLPALLELAQKITHHGEAIAVAKPTVTAIQGFVADYKAGHEQKAPTLDEIAAHFKVSRPTISKVLAEGGTAVESRRVAEIPEAVKSGIAGNIKTMEEKAAAQDSGFIDLARQVADAFGPLKGQYGYLAFVRHAKEKFERAVESYEAKKALAGPENDRLDEIRRTFREAITGKKVTRVHRGISKKPQTPPAPGTGEEKPELRAALEAMSLEEIAVRFFELEDTGLNPDEIKFRDSVRFFVDSNIVHAARALDGNGHLDHALPMLRHMATEPLWKDGPRIFGAALPAKDGGGGLGLFADVMIVEELGRASGSYALMHNIRSGLVATILSRFGTEEQKREYLQAMLRGEKIISFGLTEPGAGSDARGAMQSTALDTGDGFLLNGTKRFNTLGEEADAILFFARTAKRFSGFIVPLKDEKGNYLPGVTVQPMRNMAGMHGSGTAVVTLKDVRVSRRNVVGGEAYLDKGIVIIHSALSDGRISVAAISLGGLERTFREFLEKYSAFRAQGRDLPDWRGKALELMTDLFAGRLMLLEAVRKSARGEDYVLDAAMAKIKVPEDAVRETGDVMTLMGAETLETGHPVEMSFRDQRVATIGEGTTQVNRMILRGELMRMSSTSRFFDDVVPFYLADRGAVEEADAPIRELLGLYKNARGKSSPDSYFLGRLERRVIDLLVERRAYELMQRDAPAGLGRKLAGIQKEKIARLGRQFVNEMAVASEAAPAAVPAAEDVDIARQISLLQHEISAAVLQKFAGRAGSAALALRDAETSAGAQAVPGANGTYLLQGRKVFVLNGTGSQSFLVPAQIAGQESLFLVEAGGQEPGAVQVLPGAVLGLREAGPADIEFHGARAMLIGTPGQGGEVLKFIESLEKPGVARIAAAAGRRLAALGEAYAKSRIQFKSPIYDFPEVREMIDESLADLALMEKGGDAPFLLAQIAGRMVQLHGGHGYNEVSGIPKFWRDAQALRVLSAPLRKTELRAVEMKPISISKGQVLASYGKDSNAQGDWPLREPFNIYGLGEGWILVDHGDENTSRLRLLHVQEDLAHREIRYALKADPFFHTHEHAFESPVHVAFSPASLQLTRHFLAFSGGLGNLQAFQLQFSRKGKQLQAKAYHAYNSQDQEMSRALGLVYNAKAGHYVALMREYDDGKIYAQVIKQNYMQSTASSTVEFDSLVHPGAMAYDPVNGWVLALHINDSDEYQLKAFRWNPHPISGNPDRGAYRSAGDVVLPEIKGMDHYPPKNLFRLHVFVTPEKKALYYVSDSYNSAIYVLEPQVIPDVSGPKGSLRLVKLAVQDVLDVSDVVGWIKRQIMDLEVGMPLYVEPGEGRIFLGDPVTREVHMLPPVQKLRGQDSMAAFLGGFAGAASRTLSSAAPAKRTFLNLPVVLWTEPLEKGGAKVRVSDSGRAQYENSWPAEAWYADEIPADSWRKAGTAKDAKLPEPRAASAGPWSVRASIETSPFAGGKLKVDFNSGDGNVISRTLEVAGYHPHYLQETWAAVSESGHVALLHVYPGGEYPTLWTGRLAVSEGKIVLTQDLAPGLWRTLRQDQKPRGLFFDPLGQLRTYTHAAESEKLVRAETLVTGQTLPPGEEKKSELRSNAAPEPAPLDQTPDERYFIGRSKVRLRQGYYLTHPQFGIYRDGATDKPVRELPETDTHAKEMVKAAMEYLWGKAIEGGFRKADMIKRVLALEESATIIAKDLDTHFFFSNAERQFGDPSRLSLRLRSIFLSKKFLDRLDPKSRAAQAIVAFHLNRAQFILDLFHELYDDGHSIGEIYDQIRAQVAQPDFQDKAVIFEGIPDEEVKQILGPLIEEDEALKAAEIQAAAAKAPAALARADDLEREIDKIRKERGQVESYKDLPPIGDYSKSAHELEEIGMLFQSVGNRDKALEFYRRALAMYHHIRELDPGGLLPFKVQEDTIDFLLRAGMIEEFAQELEWLVTGKDPLVPLIYIPSDAFEAQMTTYRKGWLAEWIKLSVPKLLYTLQVYASIFPDQAKRHAVESAREKTEKLIGEFWSERAGRLSAEKTMFDKQWSGDSERDVAILPLWNTWKELKFVWQYQKSGDAARVTVTANFFEKGAKDHPLGRLAFQTRDGAASMSYALIEIDEESRRLYEGLDSILLTLSLRLAKANGLTHFEVTEVPAAAEPVFAKLGFQKTGEGLWRFEGFAEKKLEDFPLKVERKFKVSGTNGNGSPSAGAADEHSELRTTSAEGILRPDLTEIGAELRTTAEALLEETPLETHRPELRTSEALQQKFNAWLERFEPPDFKRWVVRPGMGFRSPIQWWAKQDLRPGPLHYHEGLDFAMYETTLGEYKTVEPGKAVTAILDGTVAAVFEDSMQSTILVEHDLLDASGRKLVLVYTHLNPAPGLKAGDKIKEGSLIGRIQKSNNLKSGVAPHLHLSVGYMDADYLAFVSKSTERQADPSKLQRWREAGLLHETLSWEKFNPLVEPGILSYENPLDYFGAAQRKDRFYEEPETELKSILIYLQGAEGQKPEFFPFRQAVEFRLPGTKTFIASEPAKAREFLEAQRGKLDAVIVNSAAARDELHAAYPFLPVVVYQENAAISKERNYAELMKRLWQAFRFPAGYDAGLTPLGVAPKTAALLETRGVRTGGDLIDLVNEPDAFRWLVPDAADRWQVLERVAEFAPRALSLEAIYEGVFSEEIRRIGRHMGSEEAFSIRVRNLQELIDFLNANLNNAALRKALLESFVTDAPENDLSHLILLLRPLMKIKPTGVSSRLFASVLKVIRDVPGLQDRVAQHYENAGQILDTALRRHQEFDRFFSNEEVLDILHALIVVAPWAPVDLAIYARDPMMALRFQMGLRDLDDFRRKVTLDDQMPGANFRMELRSDERVSDAQRRERARLSLAGSAAEMQHVSLLKFMEQIERHWDEGRRSFGSAIIQMDGRLSPILQKIYKANEASFSEIYPDRELLQKIMLYILENETSRLEALENRKPWVLKEGETEESIREEQKRQLEVLGRLIQKFDREFPTRYAISLPQLVTEALGGLYDNDDEAAKFIELQRRVAYLPDDSHEILAFDLFVRGVHLGDNMVESDAADIEPLEPLIQKALDVLQGLRGPVTPKAAWALKAGLSKLLWSMEPLLVSDDVWQRNHILGHYPHLSAESALRLRRYASVQGVRKLVMKNLDSILKWNEEIRLANPDMAALYAAIHWYFYHEYVGQLSAWSRADGTPVSLHEALLDPETEKNDAFLDSLMILQGHEKLMRRMTPWHTLRHDVKFVRYQQAVIADFAKAMQASRNELRPELRPVLAPEAFTVLKEFRDFLLSRFVVETWGEAKAAQFLSVVLGKPVYAETAGLHAPIPERVLARYGSGRLGKAEGFASWMGSLFHGKSSEKPGRVLVDRAWLEEFMEHPRALFIL
ncbi:MAG TPA: acyl-CoA dehydrogenase family protein, partial [Verrucomicrobiae bacterium]|nr:acyl-CoA dehydrogenase family protein [Verrucomicrobiae bacterium]